LFLILLKKVHSIGPTKPTQEIVPTICQMYSSKGTPFKMNNITQSLMQCIEKRDGYGVYQQLEEQYRCRD